MGHAHKSIEALRDELALFRVRRYALLVDDSVDVDLIRPLVDDACVGLFTFTLGYAGTDVHGRAVQLLDGIGALPECDGWVLGTGSKAVYALTQLLWDAHREQQVILTLITDRVTSMFSYVDFFKGETATEVFVHNVFERAYKIHFPIALRYVLRSGRGQILAASQRLMAPSHTVVFDSADFDVPVPLAGYLELHADVRHFNGEVSQFLHLNCDYISADAMTSVHSSGYGPWPAGSEFCRGFMPPEPDRRLTVSLYNHVNIEPIEPRAVLRGVLHGERASITRPLPPVPHRHMVFADLSALFAADLAAGISSADVVVIPDRPMHRPNFYYHRKDRQWSWDSVEHSAAPVERVLPSERRTLLRSHGLHPWVCPLPILPEAQGLDTLLYYFEDGPAALHDFRMRAYNDAGECVIDEDEHIPFGRIINMTDWVRQRGQRRANMVTLVPSDSAPAIPAAYQIMGGFVSRRHTGPAATLLAGTHAANVPVEMDRSERPASWSHAMIPIHHTEVFGKARVDAEYDTTVVLYNVSPFDRYARPAHLEIDVLTWDGRATRFFRTVPPNGSIALSVSDLIAEGRIVSDRGYYSLWVYCRDCFVYGYHVVRRRRDDALCIEHFYYSRFNLPEPKVGT